MPGSHHVDEGPEQLHGIFWFSLSLQTDFTLLALQAIIMPGILSPFPWRLLQANPWLSSALQLLKGWLRIYIVRAFKDVYFTVFPGHV